MMQNSFDTTPETEEKYTYYAFISYKHEDEKWARWIQNKLETYKLPTVLQKEIRDLPNRITPIFRDKTDITSGPLKKTLSKELQSSRFLIVICSPNAAKSIYVDYEVEQFIRMGRQDRIIPLIIDGAVRTQNPEQECFVPSLLAMEETILGVDLPTLGKHKAFLTVIATMLDIKLDTLVRRDRIRQKKKNLLATASITILLILAGFTLDYYIPKTYYYSDYVLQWGIPKGIFRLDYSFLAFGKNELKDRDDFYAVTISKSNKTITLKHMNSAMVPVDYPTETEQSDRPVFAEYDYKVTDGIKQVSDAKYFDRYGNIILVLKYSDDSTIVDFTSPDGSNTPVTLSGSLFSENGTMDVKNLEIKSSITRYIYQYDENGYISLVKFMRDNRATSPTPDQNGITGYICTVDQYGRVVTKRMNYVFDNTIHNTVFDRIYYNYAYQSPNLVSVVYTDAEDNLIYNGDFYAKKEFFYYDNGNISDIYYYGTDGEKCTGPYGYAHASIIYDNKGFIQEVDYYNENNYPVITVFGYAKAQHVHDKKGNLTQASVFDTDGNPVVALPTDIYRYVSGFSTIRRVYDEKNMLISETYYDENDEPMLCTGEYARLDTAYHKGLLSEVSYYDVNGEPKTCNIGFEKFTKEYNEFDLAINWRYCNADGTLSETTWGYSRIELEYDENRNIKSYSFYDENDRLVMTEDNIARQELVWDDRGLLSEQSNYDTVGNLVVSTAGYAKNVKEYNESGLLTKDIYYDQNEEPVYVPDQGYARYEAAYDEYGDCTYKSYYDVDGQLVMTNYGYAEYKAWYDSKAQKVEEAYYDETGSLVLPNGYDWARHTMAYTEEGLPKCESYYDADNHLVINSYTGYAKCYAEYDEWNNMRSKTFYGTDGKEFISPNLGFASVKYVYENNYLIRTSYYDEKGDLIISPTINYAEQIQKLDSNGKLLSSCTYDDTGKPILNLYGYSSVTCTYNQKGLETNRQYLDAQGKPTIALNYGYAEMDILYNKDGTWKNAVFYDQSGKEIDSNLIVTKSFVYISEVKAQSAGLKAGVHINDLILQYGDWCYFPVNEEDSMFTLLTNELERVKDLSKKVVIYRPTDASIQTYQFDSGMVGLRINSVDFSFPSQEAYMEYSTGLESAYLSSGLE